MHIIQYYYLVQQMWKSHSPSGALIISLVADLLKFLMRGQSQMEKEALWCTSFEDV